jgi:2-polyprenyl-3-methyl-5-hydroxy-6-metoxy-1,4-benzoquinol methylase
MADYLAYLERISNPATFDRKCKWLRHNFRTLFATDHSVLEIGPGRGEFLHFAREQRCAFVDVIDRDLGVLENVRTNSIVRHSWQCSAEEIQALDSQLDQYDRIFLLQVMEHIETHHLSGFLSTLYKHLKPHGKIIITVPNGGNPLSIVERYSDITHYNLFSENSLQELVELTGLPGATCNVRGYRIPPAGLVDIVRICLQRTLHLLLKGIMVVNGGMFFSIYDPNITLVVTRDS